VIAAAGFILSGVAAALLSSYRSTPLWNAANQDAFWFYHVELVLYHPILWPLFPATVLIALMVRPKPTAFCLCIFSASLILHSFAGMKHLRYVYYIMPFLFVIFGIALAHVSQYVYGYLSVAIDRTLSLFAPRAPRRPMRWENTSYRSGSSRCREGRRSRKPRISASASAAAASTAAGSPSV
jgi:hypothetical protein